MMEYRICESWDGTEHGHVACWESHAQNEYANVQVSMITFRGRRYGFTWRDA